MPRSAVSVASVMMKGGRPSWTMPKPWKAPIATPISSVRAIGGRDAEAVHHQPGHDDAAEAHHGADRQVDAGRDDHEGLAHRDDGHHGALAHQVDDVASR